MVNRKAYRFAALLMGLLALGGPALGQPPPPPAPVPVPLAPQDQPQVGIAIGSPQPAPIAPPPGTPPPALPAYQPLPPTPCPPPAPFGQPLFAPCPNGSCNADGYFFASLELAYLKPYVSNGLTAVVPRANGTVFQFSAPSTSLDWALAPRVEVGYRVPDCGAEFALAYRFLVSEGTSPEPFNGATFDVKSRFTLNAWDIDVGGTEVEIEPRWFFRWRLGARVAAVYYDTTAVNPVKTDHESNYFFGAGPHGTLDLRWQLPVLSSFALFGRADGSVLVGQIDQKFSEQFAAPANSPLNGAMQIRQSQSVPTLAAQAGLTWMPETFFRVSAGYQWEKWWSLGRAEMSRLNFSDQGFFVRAEFDF